MEGRGDMRGERGGEERERGGVKETREGKGNDLPENEKKKK